LAQGARHFVLEGGPLVTANGYVKLHRTLLEHPIFTQLSPIVLKVWLACLLRANWKPSSWYDGHQQVEIPAGAFIFSQATLAKLCHISRQNLRTALTHLKNLGCIKISTSQPTSKLTNGYSLLVIENWTTYQNGEQAANQPTNQQTNHGLTTEEEVKKLRTTNAHLENDAQVDQPSTTKPTHLVPEEPVMEASAFPEEPFSPETVNGKQHDVAAAAASAAPGRAPGLAAQQEAWFRCFWGEYWRRRSKKAARNAFRQHVRTQAQFEVVMAAMRAQKPEMLRREEEKRPYASTWLNGECWQDELEPASAPSHGEPLRIIL
jgi:hypothetical protein